MTFQSYNNHIHELTRSISEMGGLVRQMIEAALESLATRDDAHKEQVKALDKQVNQLDRYITEQATAILALRGPMGDDLRFVTSALGIASDLERAGDLAKNTTKRSLKTGSYHPVPVMDQLSAMIEIIVSMIDDAIIAIEKRDPELAIEVWVRDKKVDDCYHAILKALQEEMQKNPSEVEAITHFIFANKNFERIADYATSLARTVYYVNTGKQAGKEILKAKILAVM